MIFKKIINNYFTTAIKDSFYSLIIKLLDYLSLFLVSILLTNILSIEEYGKFVFLERMVFLLTTLFLFGQDFVVRRNTVKNIQIKKTDIDLIKTSKINILISFITFAPISYFFLIYNDVNSKVYVLFFVIAILPSMLSFLNSSILIGKRINWAGVLSRRVLGRLILFFLICLMLAVKYSLSIEILALIFLFSILFQFILSEILLKKFLDIKLLKSISGFSFKHSKNNLILGFPYLLTNMTFVLSQQIPFIILAFFNKNVFISKLDIALKISSLALIPLVVSAGVISSRVGYFFNQKKLEKINELVIKVNTWLKMYGLIFLIIIITFGPYLIQIFGNEFRDAYGLLIILSIAQFIDLSFGHTGEIMKVIGLEKVLARLSFIYLSINSILVFVFYENLLGIGISFLISTIIFNYLKSRFLYNKTFIMTHLFNLNYKMK